MAAKKRAAGTGGKQYRTHHFKPGQSGKPAGRPKSSRNKISEDFVAALCADFEEHGTNVIATVRDTNPTAYMRIVADLIPKDFNVKHDGGEAFLELWRHMSRGE